MNYELCKKLKDAGFPIRTGAPTDNSFDLYDLDPKPENWMAHMHQPTLSELIEACGDKFNLLLRNPRNQWEAGEAFNNTREPNHFPGGLGKTPEEAVANLWLTLNQHEKEKVQL